MIDKPKLVCLTPIKNEGWILEKFLTITSLWADYIIIADQNSTDNSIEIAQKFEKVILVKNEGEYNEFERTKILLKEARKIEGNKILFALDADEFLSSNYMDSPEWDTILNSPKKTIFNFERVNLTPDFNQYFGGIRMIIALVDDNESSIEETSKAIIHNIRLPWPKNAQVIHLNDIKILHLDYISSKRVLSKLRWYQCFEKQKFNQSDKFLKEKYKVFSNINDFLKNKDCKPLHKNWILHYKENKIDFTSYREPFLWWDIELLKLFNQEGINKFKGLNVQNVDWINLARKYNYNKLEHFEIKNTFMNKVINRLNKK